MSVYQSKQFKSLKKRWYKKLKRSGFCDAEYESGRLKQKDQNTLAFKSRDEVLEFYIRLDNYLNDHQDIIPLHRRILELHSQGVRSVHIKDIVRRDYSTVKRIIAIYRRLLLGK